MTEKFLSWVFPFYMWFNFGTQRECVWRQKRESAYGTCAALEPFIGNSTVLEEKQK